MELEALYAQDGQCNEQRSYDMLCSLERLAEHTDCKHRHILLVENGSQRWVMETTWCWLLKFVEGGSNMNLFDRDLPDLFGGEA